MSVFLPDSMFVPYRCVPNIQSSAKGARPKWRARYGICFIGKFNINGHSSVAAVLHPSVIKPKTGDSTGKNFHLHLPSRFIIDQPLQPVTCGYCLNWSTDRDFCTTERRINVIRRQRGDHTKATKANVKGISSCHSMIDIWHHTIWSHLVQSVFRCNEKFI